MVEREALLRENSDNHARVWAGGGAILTSKSRHAAYERADVVATVIGMLVVFLWVNMEKKEVRTHILKWTPTPTSRGDRRINIYRTRQKFLSLVARFSFIARKLLQNHCRAVLLYLHAAHDVE